jgi:Tfp pilus assembly protein PilE
LDSSLITILSNLGTGGIVIILLVLGYLVPKPAYTRAVEDADRKDEEIAKLAEALALERQRSNDATQAATVTNQLIGALTTLATEHRAAEKHEHADAAAKASALPGAPLDLTGGDLGL